MKIKPLGIVWVSMSFLIAPAFLQAAQICDRQCLVDLMKDYLAALVAHIQFPVKILASTGNWKLKTGN